MHEYRAYAKVNIFLKITGTRGNYHEILSRFMRVPELYDTLEFFAKDTPAFVLEGDFTCKTAHNTIYKAYRALQDATDNAPALETLMEKFGIRVTKRIPAFAGLGGGSSDAAAFLHMCNDAAALGLDTDTLAAIGAKVGADVPFFVYGYDSANVSGIGEVVEAFEEDLLELKIVTPKLEISTPKVYRTYREHFFAPIDALTCKALAATPSRDILNSMDAKSANDLFAPALHAYPGLALHVRDGWFFSGSGSSFFRPKES